MLSIGIVTISDSSARGERKDRSGMRIQEIIQQRLADATVSNSTIIPDEQEKIGEILREWSDVKQLNLILTTGGTGVAPRDVTPEATLAVIEREVPGIAEALRTYSLQYTPMAMISRGRAGIRGKTLIINLPGSPKAVGECLEYLLPVLPHAINLLTEGPREH